MSKNFEQIIKSAMNVETKQLDKASLDDFKDKNVMTFGTFDLFHIGHQKIIEHCLEICGEESRLFIAVSSDR